MDDDRKVLEVRNLQKVFVKNDGTKILVLDDVNFDLNKGEILGVIGRNGSGKSTLLKVLSKISGPTDGEIQYSGILKSIIEIGTGFHPDLSGKENVKLNAQLLGIPWNEFKLIYDELVEFSGLEDFMNMPVKHYSSGMYLRLAFSIAFHSKIDILLLDEVLAVGDAEFRRKCYHKIRELRDEGTAIIFVSHQMEPIIEFCERCMWLDNGRVEMIGKPMDVIENYLDSSLNQNDKIRGERIDSERIAYEIDYASLNSEFLKVNAIFVYAQGKDLDENITVSDDIIIKMECDKLVDFNSFEIIYTLWNINNVRVLTDSYGLRRDYSIESLKKGKYEVICRIPANLLTRGVYSVGIAIGRSREFVKEVPNVFNFKVHTEEEDVYGIEISSIIRPHLDWTVELKKSNV